MDAAFQDAADAALRKAMEARNLEDLLDAIHENNGHASPEVLDGAALRDELKEEKRHPPAGERLSTEEGVVHRAVRPMAWAPRPQSVLFQGRLPRL